jgi:enolase
MTTEIGETTTVIGDDLLVGNKERTTKGINNKWCNAILIKPNQVGTISETIEVVHQAQLAGWQVIVSHRGGETNDDFIADFAVGIGAAYTKFGPPNRGERIAKYNRLLQIDQEIAQRNAAIQTATRAPMETPAPVAAAPIETTLPPATPPESTAPAPAV